MKSRYRKTQGRSAWPVVPEAGVEVPELWEYTGQARAGSINEHLKACWGGEGLM